MRLSQVTKYETPHNWLTGVLDFLIGVASIRIAIPTTRWDAARSFSIKFPDAAR